MRALLDPWSDAERIGAHLATPGAELVVVLGAEAWCDKCRRLRPRFEALSRLARAETLLPLWLDLEEHAQFLGDFLPPDLPLLLRWRDGVCVQAAVLVELDPQAADPAQRVQLQELALAEGALHDPREDGWVALPRLWEALSQGDWAEG